MGRSAVINDLIIKEKKMSQVEAQVQDSEILANIESSIEEIKPFLQRDGGDIEFVEYTSDNIVNVRLQGACSGCPGATITLQAIAERIIKEEYRRKIEEGELMLERPDHASASGLGAGVGVAASENDSHEEFSILDKAGRVRLSAEMREAVGIDSNRVKINVVDGKIIISSEDDD